MLKMEPETQMMIDIKAIVLEVRKDLAKRYDVEKGSKYERYAGLCFEASTMLCKALERYATEKHMVFVDTEIVHGEQRHNPRIKSMFWPIQHTWARVVLNRQCLYIDATAGQFQYLYKDMPDYYISGKPPKWFYPDKKNPAWHWLTRRINKRFLIKHKLPGSSEGSTVSDGIIEFCQYEIWGKISDCFRKVIYGR